MNKTEITEEIADRFIRLLYTMYAEKLGVEIEITKKGEENEKSSK